MDLRHLRYFQAVAGLGVVPESVILPESVLRFVPLQPALCVPLVLVWHEDENPPTVQRFRELLLEWKDAGKLWRQN